MKPLRLVLLVLVLSGTAFPALAQEPEPQLTLRLSKNFGFGLGSRIQGTFTLSVQGPQDLLSVDFWIDDQVLASEVSSPFQVRFSTRDYPLGPHTLLAVGITADGAVLRSEPRTVHFISAETAWQEVQKIIIPLAIGLGILILLGTIVPLLVSGRRPSRPGVYGFAGGAVCPRCRLPFSRHALSLNLPTGKLERCPHCRKWSLVRRASATQLEEAEARLTKGAIVSAHTPEQEQERLARLIDDSRYREDRQ